MHIWLISAFEPTPFDHSRPMRFMGIANAALKRAHQVTFFTTTFHHNSKKHRYKETTYKSVDQNIYDVIFVHSKPYKKNISWERMMAHRHFAEKLIEEINNQSTKPDVIYISLPPLSTVEAVTAWAKEKGIPVIVDIIDPWPDVFLKVFPSAFSLFGKMAMAPLYQKLRRIVRDCSAVVSISEQYTTWAKTFANEAKTSNHFYPAVPYDEIRESLNELSLLQKSSGKLRIIYAGSLASSYDIPTILGAAEILEKKYPGKTEFAIAGVGPQEALIKQKALKNVVALGWLGQKEIIKEYYLSDLGLTQHVKGATQSVTYKLFDYLSAGLPILNSLESEMALIIERNKVGFNNVTGDADGLATNIEKFLNNPALLQEYKQNALKLTEEKGDSKIVYDKLVQFVESVKAGAHEKQKSIV